MDQQSVFAVEKPNLSFADCSCVQSEALRDRVLRTLLFGKLKR